MENPNKTENQLKDELIKARQRITELEKLKNKYRSAEEQIKLLNSILKAIQNVNQLIVREKNRDILLQKTCDILTEARSYHAVWFGLLRENGTFSTVKGSGFREDISFFGKQLMDGNYPNCIKNAFSKRDLLMIVDKSRTCRDCYFKNAGAGKAAVILRVEYNKQLFGLLAIYLIPDLYIRAEEEKLLKEVAGDLAYALHKLELEKEYKQAEELFKKLFIHSPNAIFIMQDGKFKLINPQFTKETGYSEEEIIKFDLFKLIYPKDRKMVREKVIKMLKGELPSGFEYRGIHKSGEIRWTSQVVASINYQGQRAILGSFKDITEIRQVQKELQESYGKLQKSMEGMINTIAKITETRDPYTAGHQLKVSELATAIAREMKLPPDKIEGIRIASLVHDIGKISIPAEILSKPTKLNEIEYSLIKDHSQIGYDILKKVDFLWPVAEIVLQHHEKINGSGYPRGLKGDEILLEARILGVTDVVEAMSSHRPYRPAKGIGAALEEISQNKGILYDPEVVDACLKLFKEKSFKFKS